MLPRPTNCQPPAARFPRTRSRVRSSSQFLNRAEGEAVSDVESGRSLLGAQVARVLRSRLQNRPGGAGQEAAQHGAGVVDGLAEGVARLEADSRAQRVLAHRRLQRMVGGVRSILHRDDGGESAVGPARCVEVGVRRKRRVRAGIPVRKTHARQLDSRSANVGRIQRHVGECAVRWRPSSCRCSRCGRTARRPEPRWDAATCPN